MSTARQSIREPLTQFLKTLQDDHKVKITTGLVHALRAFSVECFELGRQELYNANTLPAPKKEEDDIPLGAYSLTGRKPDKV